MTDWKKIEVILILMVGLSFILFRRSYSNMLIKRYRKHPRAKKRNLDTIFREEKFGGIIHRVYEIASVVVGVVFVLGGISEIFPKINQPVMYIVFFFILILFSAGFAILIEFFLLFPSIWKNVQKYMQEHHFEQYQKYNLMKSGKIGFTMAGEPIEDPILHLLRKKATINTVICFIPLFILIFVGLYTLIKITS